MVEDSQEVPVLYAVPVCETDVDTELEADALVLKLIFSDDDTEVEGVPLLDASVDDDIEVEAVFDTDPRVDDDTETDVQLLSETCADEVILESGERLAV